MSFRLLVLVCLLLMGARDFGVAESALPAGRVAAVTITSRAFGSLVPRVRRFSLTPEFRIVRPGPGLALLTGKPHRDNAGRDQVVIGHDFTVGENQSVEGNVVVVRGNVEVRGTINGDLAVVGSHGSISGTVNGDVACVASAVRLANRCIINGDLTSVASAIDNQPDAEIHGTRTNVDVFPAGAIDAAGNWFAGTILLFRPMAPGDVLSWSIALATLLFCLLVGVVCPQVLEGTGRILQERAPAAFLSGVAIVPATALLCFLLLLTVIGILAVPVLLAAVIVFALVGNAAAFQVIGQRLAPRLVAHPQGKLLSLLLGALVCWVLYSIPVVGFLVGSLVFVGGLGAVGLYLLDRSRGRRHYPTQRGLEPVQRPRPLTNEPEVPTVLEAQARVPATLAIPRATFWPRLLANLIDLVVLYSILYFLGFTRVLVPTWVAYRFAMFAWRSATLGGIVLRLQVIKTDGTFLTGDYSTSFIRALGSLLSLLPLGLGFFWILFDPERNAWHDHISQTFVVQMELPRPKALAAAGAGAGLNS